MACEKVYTNKKDDLDIHNGICALQMDRTIKSKNLFRKQNNVAEKYNAFLVMTYQWKSNYRGSNPIISAVVI